MGRPKGDKGKQPNRYWSKEAKFEYVKLILEGEISMTQLSKENNVSLGMLSQWVKRYEQGGIEALENKRHPGNPVARYHNKKSMTPVERLEYENMMLKIENERLKKGYTNEEVLSIRRRKSFKKNLK